MATIRVHAPLLWSAGIIWPVATTATIAARFVTRKVQRIRLGWDDWLILPAWVLTCGLSAALLAGVAEKSMGYSTPDVAPGQSLTATSRQQTVTRKVYYVFVVLQTPALAFIKLSCVAFYARIFRTGQNRFTEFVLWTFAAIILAWGIAFTVVGLFSCGNLDHLNYLWTSLENQEKCTVDSAAFQKGTAISDVINDLMLLIFPIPHVWRLNMRTSRKIGLSVVFLFGSLSIAASAVRLAILYESLEVEFTTHIDEDFLSTSTAYFMLLECGFGIIAVCLPTLASATKIAGVQTFFNNISHVFSLRSRSVNSSKKGFDDTMNHTGKEDFQPYTGPSNGASSRTEGVFVALDDLEARLGEQNGVRVTKTVELQTHGSVDALDEGNSFDQMDRVQRK